MTKTTVCLTLLSFFCLIGFGMEDGNAEQRFLSGYVEVSVTDPVTGLQFPMGLWYPSKDPEESIQRGPFTLDVAHHGAPIEEKFPLVVLSHGSGASMFSHRSLSQHLARQGFVVATPQHVGNNFQDNSIIGTRKLLESRPRSITAILDQLISNTRYNSYIDADNIGIIGYSMGGFTALAVLGAEPSLQTVITHCDEHPEDPFCQYPFPKSHSEQDLLPVTNLKDSRIKTAILLDPATGWLSNNELSNINMDLVIYLPEVDDQLSAEFHALRVEKYVKGNHSMRLINSASHYSFITPFPDHMREFIGEVAKDPEGFDRQAFHIKLNDEITEILTAKFLK